MSISQEKPNRKRKYAISNGKALTEREIKRVKYPDKIMSTIEFPILLNGGSGQFSLLKESEIPAIQASYSLERNRNVPINRKLLNKVLASHRVYMTPEEVTKWKIRKSGYSDNRQIPRNIEFGTYYDQHTDLYSVWVNHVGKKIPVSTIFKDQQAIQQINDSQLAIFKYTGSLPTPYSGGDCGNLYEVNISPQESWLIKIEKCSRTRQLTPKTYQEVLQVAQLLHKASLETWTNEVIGLVYLPHQTNYKYHNLCWGIVFKKIPNCMTIKTYLQQHQSMWDYFGFKPTYHKLLNQCLEIATCLWKLDIYVDTYGQNNIIIDSVAQQVYFIDLEHKMSGIDCQKLTFAEYLARMRSYFNRCAGHYT